MNATKDILSTLAYFDLFDYPLTHTEIFLFLGNSYSTADFNSSIQALIKERFIYPLDDYYSLQNNPALATRRKTGNQKAKKLLKTAEKIARFLSYFPFVRGVGISGSLSKKYADDRSDIDLFIITVKDRLWIARTFLHFFKKLSFLVNRQHYFCMNYFVDEEGLEIREKNIFTAMEIATLLPLEGAAAFERFYSENSWVTGFLPNYYLEVSCAPKPEDRPYLKRILERLWNNAYSNRLDKALMHITGRRWQEKTKAQKRNGRGFIMGMDASRHCAKPDPENFQVKLLQQYEHKVQSVLNAYSLNPGPFHLASGEKKDRGVRGEAFSA